LLGLSKPLSNLRTFDAEPLRGAQATPVEIETEAGVWVPAWIFEPRPAKPKGTMLLLQSSRLVGFREEELFHQLALAGWRVCIPDLRGAGDLTPEFGRGAARHARNHNEEESWAWASLFLGKPLAGQRVTDIRAAVGALGERVTVAAIGRMTVPALIAASLEPRIETLYLAGGLVSFRSIIHTENYTHPFANFIPGIVNHTDLPEIARGVSKLVLAGVVDAAGKPVAGDAVRELYPRAAVEAKPAWDAARLSSL
jgi:hypothetical protein